MEVKISIIIPAYNVKPYVTKCVESVINQSYTNLEIILIDDGSTDGTSRICDELAQRDNRIIVIHQQNKGLSEARNAGLNVATGEWIAFLDSDDWIECEMYEHLLKMALEYGADISSCSSRNVYGNEKSVEQIADEKISVFEKEKIIEGLITQEMIRYEVWNKLWKRDFISDVRFIPGQVSEDVHFDRVLFLKANKIVHTNQIYHNYLISRPGNTNSTFKFARMCVYDEFEQMFSAVEGNLVLQNIVAMLAMKFAVNMYVESINAKQNKVSNELILKFDYFYKRVAEKKFKNNHLVRLFHISPKCCYIAVKILTWVRK